MHDESTSNSLPLIQDPEQRQPRARFPAISLSAEYLAMGYLLRRNILTYKAPPFNEGYDLLCSHPNPRLASRQLRVQVKSRMASDADRGFPLKARSLDAFDYLIVVFLNVGYYLQKARYANAVDGAREPEFYVLTPDFLRVHHNATSSWEKVILRGLNIDDFKNEKGIEFIARDLEIPYPSKIDIQRPANP